MTDEAETPVTEAAEPVPGPAVEPVLDTRTGDVRRQRFMIFGISVAVAALILGIYWLVTRGDQSTDDAFVDGDVVSLSSEIPGKVLAVHFTDNEFVERGDLLIEIDPRAYAIAEKKAEADLEAAEAAVDTATANLQITQTAAAAGFSGAEHEATGAGEIAHQAEAQAEAAHAESVRAAADAERGKSLFADHVMSRQGYDQMLETARAAHENWQAARRAAAAAQARALSAQAQADQAHTVPAQIALRQAQLQQASAQADQARAALQAAQLDLAHCHIVAPERGRIAQKDVNPGDVVSAGQMLSRLVIGAPWITANFKESQITDIVPGQPVQIRIDAYPGQVFPGFVDSIEPGTGTHFSLLPAENATGNFVKVVQRVPVKIVFDDPDDVNRYLVLGMSAVPTIDTTAVGAAVPTRTEPRAETTESGRTPDGSGAK